MAEEIISCHGCQRRLRLPEAVLGQKVRCPMCGAIFTAAAEMVVDAAEETGPDESFAEEAPRRRSPVNAHDEDDEPGKGRGDGALRQPFRKAREKSSYKLVVWLACGGLLLIL